MVKQKKAGRDGRGIEGSRTVGICWAVFPERSDVVRSRQNANREEGGSVIASFGAYLLVVVGAAKQKQRTAGLQTDIVLLTTTARAPQELQWLYADTQSRCCMGAFEQRQWRWQHALRTF